MLRLEEQGISTRQGTHALVTLGYYAKKYALRSEQFPNAVLAEALSLTLPLYPQMTEAEQTMVVNRLCDLFHDHHDESGVAASKNDQPTRQL